MTYSATECSWFSIFLEKALVRRVNRRMVIRIVRFWRSTKLVEMCALSGVPLTCDFLQPVQTGGE